MKCDEVQTLHGPYLDSELDARTSLEIEQHLKACAPCARLFAEEEKLEARIKAGLKGGLRTPALWEQIERGVLGDLTQRRKGTERNGEEMNPLFVSALAWLQAGWQRSRWVWASLAAVWAVILALNGAARESDAQVVAGKQLPPAAEVRFAVEQKHLLMADLAFTTEPVPADKPKAAPPSPRSDRRKAALNT